MTCPTSQMPMTNPHSTALVSKETAKVADSFASIDPVLSDDSVHLGLLKGVFQGSRPQTGLQLPRFDGLQVDEAMISCEKSMDDRMRSAFCVFTPPMGRNDRSARAPFGNAISGRCPSLVMPESLTNTGLWGTPAGTR